MVDYPPKGEREYFDEDFRNQLKQVNDASIRVSDSNIQTNAFVQLLNNKIIPEYNTFQKHISRVTLAVAILSLIAIGSSAYFSALGVTSRDVKELRQQLERNNAILDNIARHQQGIDSVLKRIVSDTSHHKDR